MKRRSFAFAVLLSTALGSGALGGCDSCKRSRRTDQQEPKLECTSDKDCADDNACTREECRADTCATSFVELGTSCDNANVCDGVAKCDGQGKCLKGSAPAIDDGNACTIDSCDPVHGVTREAVAIDDYDECIRDACDPRSG